MPRERMPDIVVLLPGITGSVLTKDNSIVWGWSGKSLIKAVFTGGRSMVEKLSLTDDPPDVDDLQDGIKAERLIPDLHLFPHFWKIDGYSKIADFIKRTFEVTPGDNYFEFPYDWRRDNRVAARKLARESRCWLTRWREKSGKSDAKLLLVAHSMGGLVSRYFIECLEGWRDTRALITFGTPYRGSLNALDTLANGERKGPGGVLNLTALARSLTAIYQLLPIYPCYDAGNGSLVRVGETAGIPNVDARKAADALAFHREIEHAVQRHEQDATYLDNRYVVFPIVGAEQPTSQSAQRAGNEVEMLRSYEGEDMSGDGTVPLISATPIEYSNAKSEMYAATRHASLQNADPTHVQLRGVMNRLYLGDLGRFRKPEDAPAAPPPPSGARLSLDVEDVFALGEPLTMRVRSDAPVDGLNAVLIDGDTNAEVARRNLARADSWQTIEFPSPRESGIYRVVVGSRSGVADVFPVADLLAVSSPSESVDARTE